jgi:hypothetical protein
MGWGLREFADLLHELALLKDKALGAVKHGRKREE